jgi:hypothetical protein
VQRQYVPTSNRSRRRKESRGLGEVVCPYQVHKSRSICSTRYIQGFRLGTGRADVVDQRRALEAVAVMVQNIERRHVEIQLVSYLSSPSNLSSGCPREVFISVQSSSHAPKSAIPTTSPSKQSFRYHLPADCAKRPWDLLHAFGWSVNQRTREETS